jgi:predicted solute-binding protein
VTRESASGRNLLRVLLERRYGVRATFVESDDPFAQAAAGRPALLIGDRAIDAQQTFAPANVHDLGKYWHEWTGLDMVFAVWAVRRDVLARHPERGAAKRSTRWWRRSAGVGQHGSRRRDGAGDALARPAGYYAAYYDTLNFVRRARAGGLARYCEELFALGAIPRCPRSSRRCSLSIAKLRCSRRPRPAAA